MTAWPQLADKILLKVRPRLPEALVALTDAGIARKGGFWPCLAIA